MKAFRSIVRLFLAINLTPEVRHTIAEAAAPLKALAPELSWVKEDKIHLTVKFLGEQPEEMAAKVTEAMRSVGTRNRTIDVEIGGVGAFPNFRRPRVVWIGVTPDPKLELLHHDVESACESLGLPVDGKPFRPHLTLARVKSRATDPRALRDLASAAKEVAYVEEVVIDAVDLMESELTTSGSRYRVIASTPLRA
jgi:2'-5' RNA ligase